MSSVRWAVLNTMNDCRCTFLELNVVKQQTANYAVDVVKSLCEVHPDYNIEGTKSVSVYNFFPVKDRIFFQNILVHPRPQVSTTTNSLIIIQSISRLRPTPPCYAPCTRILIWKITRNV